jgi:hypothetical protein
MGEWQHIWGVVSMENNYVHYEIAAICGCSCPQSFVKGGLIHLLCSDKGLSRVHDIMIGNWMNEYERRDQHGAM